MNKNNIFVSRRPLIAILRGITPLEASKGVIPLNIAIKGLLDTNILFLFML